MSQYLRCVRNETYFADDLSDSFFELRKDRIYRQLPLLPEESGSGMVRIVDDSGEAYLYPSVYFEPVAGKSDRASPAHQVAVYLDKVTKGVLHAEALVAHKSVSALLREWIDERLDLAVHE